MAILMVASRVCGASSAEATKSTPISPPSGPTQWLFQGPPAESKFLAAKQAEIETEILSLLGNPVLTTGQKQQVCIAAHALYKAWPEKKDRSIEVLRKMEQYAPASDLGQAAKNLRNHLSPSKP